MTDLIQARNVGASELTEWRERAWERTRGNPMRYGVSPGARMAAPLVEADERGNAQLEIEAVGPKRSGRELADIMEEKRHEMLQRLALQDPEAKLAIVRMLRRANPAMLAKFPDDAEAVKHLNTLIRQDAQAISKRALARDSRDATLIYGR